ncbi:unnamed protein product [Blepharisma stoltei]|uniref:RING-type domain-containing protein n=1 Tax=Blepharisma stoltei TaxID=1481888 RepID=A0AAU9KBI5_9CILI|nr:unnamed protein product [Blepharisma stoltei]
MNGQLPHIESIDNNAVHGPYRDIIRSELKNWLHQAMMIGIALILLVIKTGSSEPLEISLIPLFLYDFYEIGLISKSLKKANSTIPQKFYIREIIAQQGNILFKTLLIFSIEFSNFNIALAGIPLYVSNAISLFFRTDSKIESLNLSYSLKFCSRWIFSIAFLLFSLKLNDIIGWNWHFVFWPIYAADLILIVITLGMIFLNVTIFYKTITGKASCLDLICPFWLLLTALGSGASLFLNFYLLADVLEYDDISELAPGLGLGIFYIMSFVIYTFLFFEYLVKWFDMFFNSRYIEVPVNHTSFEQLQRQLGFTNRIAILFKDPPKFLKRISSTFYKPTSEAESKSYKRTTSQIINADKEEGFELKFNSVIVDNSEAEASINNAEKLCIICCVNKANAVIMQCGHAGICFSCGSELVKNESKCMICRNLIEQVLEIKESENNESVVSVVNVAPSPPEEVKED